MTNVINNIKLLDGFIIDDDVQFFKNVKKFIQTDFEIEYKQNWSEALEQGKDVAAKLILVKVKDNFEDNLSNEGENTIKYHFIIADNNATVSKALAECKEDYFGELYFKADGSDFIQKIKKLIKPTTDNNNNYNEKASGEVFVAGSYIENTSAYIYLQNQFNTLFNNTPLSIIFIDKLFNISFFNSLVTDLLEFESAELLKMNFIKLLASDDAEVFNRVLNELKTNGKRKVTLNFKLITKHKKVLWTEATIAPILNKKGVINEMILFCKNLTSTIKAQQLLQDNEEKYKELYYAETDAIFLVDNKSKQILEANNAAVKLYGFQVDEFLGLTFNELLTDQKNSKVKNSIEKIKLNLVNPQIQYHKHKNGKSFPVELSGRVFHQQHREVEILTIRNVSDRISVYEELEKYKEELEYLVEERTKQIEQQNKKLQKSQLAMTYLIEDANETRAKLSKAYDKVKAVNKELEAFAYSVSHDLRAPLTRINGFGKAILDYVNDTTHEKVKHYLSRIQASSETMASLIDNILKLSRISRAQMEIQEVDIAEIANEIILELIDDKSFKNYNYVVHPEIKIMCDAELVKILLLNLISNAFKFSAKADKPKIEVGLTQINNEKVIFVTDNGVGFDMKYYDQLFAPFSRLHTDEEYTGSGIGLATVQRVVNRHGGNVWAESELNKGTTFYIVL